MVIPEPITSFNKGEAAILGGLVEVLRPCGDFRISVFSPPTWIEDDRRNYDWVRTLAAPEGAVHFDLRTALASNGGQLSEHHIQDGVHLHGEGYLASKTMIEKCIRE